MPGVSDVGRGWRLTYCALSTNIISGLARTASADDRRLHIWKEFYHWWNRFCMAFGKSGQPQLRTVYSVNPVFSFYTCLHILILRYSDWQEQPRMYVMLYLTYISAYKYKFSWHIHFTNIAKWYPAEIWYNNLVLKYSSGNHIVDIWYMQMYFCIGA